MAGKKTDAATPKASAKRTYTILRLEDDSQLWELKGTQEAISDAQAKKLAAEQYGEGTYVAITRWDPTQMVKKTIERWATGDGSTHTAAGATDDEPAAAAAS